MTLDFPWLRRIEVQAEGMACGGNGHFVATGKNDALRITAEIHKSILGVPGRSQVAFYNLAPATRKGFVRNQTKIRIMAGWEEGPFPGVSQCFYGEVLSVFTRRQGPDIVTTVNAVSTIDKLTRVTLVKTYDPYEPVKPLVLELAGLLVGKANACGERIVGIDNRRLGERGLIVSDYVRNILRDLGATFGFSWAVSDECFRAVGDQATLGHAATIEPPFLIAASPAVFGSLQDADGVTWTSTFNPAVEPGFAVTVASAFGEARENNINGTYRVDEATHRLDCHSDSSFITEGRANNDTRRN